MPYPLTLRPNATVDIRNQASVVQATDLPAQIFKPLVGTTGNDTTRPPFGALDMEMRAIIRVAVVFNGVIPLSPSTLAGGAWLLQTKQGAAVIGTFVICGGLRWDDDTYYLICTQL
jgi:hypothetical protein